MTSESELLAAITLAHSRNDTRLWRANAGQAWSGQIVRRTAIAITLSPYHPVRLAPEGFSDLFGLQRTLITPELVGRYLGVFAGIEVKSETGRLRESQALFLDMLRTMGALHGVARSVEDAGRILAAWRDLQ